MREQETKRALIISGGSLEEDFASAYLKDQNFDMIIAVDSGLKGALDLGLSVDAAVGDFDSADPLTLAEGHEHREIHWEVHRPEKDETDTELALRKAMALGCEEIAVLGATGGRADHMMGNVQLLFQCLQKGVFAYLADPQNKIYLLDGEREYQKGQVWGKYISFLPLTERVYGITLEGFKYPLKDRDIEIGTSLCISNELSEERGRITFRDGVLICVEAHD